MTSISGRGLAACLIKKDIKKDKKSMSGRPNESPPPYESDGYAAPPQPAYSYYPDDEFQHFYRWTSPPGVLKIMSIIVIVMCVAIFACVASTLAWDVQGAMSGFGLSGGGVGGGYPGSFGGAAYGPENAYGYGGLGGNYNDPRSAKGFIIAVAAITFFTALAIFIIIVSHRSISESRRFYLAVTVVSTILALLVLIAAIVYLMAINPTAQSQGTVYGSQIASLCAQYQRPQVPGVFVNQYLYHYCVVEPQEAIAVVFGFLVAAALIIMVVFAVKTRKKIINYGKSNILWKLVKVMENGDPPQHVEAWVNNVLVPPEELPMADFPENPGMYEASNYNKSRYTPPSASRVNRRRGDPDVDYASSGDELDNDDADFYSEFPPIANEQERNEYKREFERDHMEYKDLQMELDAINKKFSDVDRELDRLKEGSPQFLDALDEYNRTKDFKKSSDYCAWKRRSKYLKAKLNHIKKMISNYDHMG
ncbi:occludin isoform X2 [Stigmatopora argus]